MRPKIDMNKLKHLPTAEDMFVEEYGAKGTVSREEFDAKSRAWYYAEVLKNARKSAGITQQQLADKIGKKREYVAMLEKGETDMQLSTFIMMSEAVGLKFALTYWPFRNDKSEVIRYTDTNQQIRAPHTLRDALFFVCLSQAYA